jgi:hypothetical protein
MARTREPHPIPRARGLVRVPARLALAPPLARVICGSAGRLGGICHVPNAVRLPNRRLIDASRHRHRDRRRGNELRPPLHAR